MVAPGNPLIGSYVRDSFIMSLHPAEILAVRYSGTFAMRHGDDVTQSHQIEAYDTMLVESYPSFEKAFKVCCRVLRWNSRDRSVDSTLLIVCRTQTGSAFLSVTPIESSTPPRNYTKVDTSRMLVSGLIVILMIIGIVGYSDFIFEWAIVAAFLLIWTQCLTVSEAFKAVKGPQQYWWPNPLVWHVTGLILDVRSSHFGHSCSDGVGGSVAEYWGSPGTIQHIALAVVQFASSSELS